MHPDEPNLAGSIYLENTDFRIRARAGFCHSSGGDLKMNQMEGGYVLVCIGGLELARGCGIGGECGGGGGVIEKEGTYSEI